MGVLTRTKQGCRESEIKIGGGFEIARSGTLDKQRVKIACIWRPDRLISINLTLLGE
ncbi:hypothetical protein PILCRDRAFT_319525 [Piloderma croceum F 1598]|uniref:Uncharacterized protein n=1 Tax=Piloderma croceum (strain F 1598) TaxID=765440 RepID=A0A0C3G2Y1_PILCF|nr:hypothetical protein PILCRDRAFT_319525 [Piloderma croceum F 1598]